MFLKQKKIERKKEGGDSKNNKNFIMKNNGYTEQLYFKMIGVFDQSHYIVFSSVICYSRTSSLLLSPMQAISKYACKSYV